MLFVLSLFPLIGTVILVDSVYRIIHLLSTPPYNRLISRKYLHCLSKDTIPLKTNLLQGLSLEATIAWLYLMCPDLYINVSLHILTMLF